MDEAIWPIARLGATFLAVLAAIIVGFRTRASVLRLAPIGRIAAIGLVLVGVTGAALTVAQVAFALGTADLDPADRQAWLGQVAVWAVAALTTSVAFAVAGAFLVVRRPWALALGIGLCAADIGMTVLGNVRTALNWRDPGALPEGWILGPIGEIAVAVALLTLLVYHQRDPWVATAGDHDVGSSTREHGAFSAGILAGLAFLTVGYGMWALSGETAHLIGSGVAVPLGAFLGYRYAGHARSAVPMRALAVRLGIVGAIAGGTLAVLVNRVLTAFAEGGFFVWWAALISTPISVITALPGVGVVAICVAWGWIRFMRSGVLAPPADDTASWAADVREQQ